MAIAFIYCARAKLFENVSFSLSTVSKLNDMKTQRFVAPCTHRLRYFLIPLVNETPQVLKL